MTVLADIDRLRGEWELAIDNCLQALRSWPEFGQFGGAARCLECLAFVARATSGPMSGAEKLNTAETGVMLLAAADSLGKQYNTPMNVIEQHEHSREVAAFQEALGQEAFQEALARGQRLSLEEAIDLAASELEPLAKNAAAG